MQKNFITLAIILLATISTQGQRFEMVWSEEFEGTELNGNLWTPWLGTAYNNELQYYSNRTENLYVEDGNLHLRAQKEYYRGRDYTSARIRTQGKYFFKYGKIEARIRLPQGKGFWPAFWLMPQKSVYGGWPKSGEIDIMEFRGQEVNSVTQAIHFSYENSHHSQGNQSEFAEVDFTEGFHLFKLEWDQKGLTWLVDNKQVFSLSKEEMYANPYPFDEEFYVILNLAVGGHFLENPDETTPFPSEMEVDYVRVYQNVNKPPVVVPSVQDIQIEPGEQITIPFTSQDEDGTIERIDVFVDSDSIQTVSPETTEISIDSLMLGCHNITFHAFDNDNGKSVSDSVSVTVGEGCERAPFYDEPLEFTESINLVDFDRGGNGVGYLDRTPNSNNDQSYRPFDGIELVSVDESEPTNAPVGVHFDDAGEWTSYSVDIPTSGTYDLELRYKSLSSSNYPLLILNLGEVRLYRFLWISHNNGEIGSLTTSLELPEGEHILYLLSDNDPIVVYELSTNLVTSLEENYELPSEISVSEAYPNPFNPETTLQLKLESSSQVKADVYSITGIHIGTIMNSQLSAGEHTLSWNAQTAASGVYVIAIQAGNQRIMRKVTLLK
jgi:beta-glucanase (GH16 family)